MVKILVDSFLLQLVALLSKVIVIQNKEIILKKENQENFLDVNVFKQQYNIITDKKKNHLTTHYSSTTTFDCISK